MLNIRRINYAKERSIELLFKVHRLRRSNIRSL
nr:MAG TPA: hypothetical protein [Caudoviricetes sp.]